MKNILINGLNAKAGGGKSILNNYLSILKEKKLEEVYFVLTPCKRDYLNYETKNIKIIDIAECFKINAILPITYGFLLNKIANKYKINSIFNLADIPIVTKTYQVFLFDWPYGVYPESKIWAMMSFKELYTRKVKLFFFKKYLKYVHIVIAQNSAMQQRLEKIYGLSKIEVVNNAVSLENLNGESQYNFNFPKGINLMYLTHYYPHKNIEIFIPLAKEIKRLGLNYHFITTIDATQSKGAQEFLRNVKKHELGDIIINVGSVEMKNVPSLYQQCDGLLMPTLLESFSGTYVEAMFHDIPIFTSNFDFAQVVCGDAAKYFNPFDVNDIVKNIENVFRGEDEKQKMAKAAMIRLKNLSTWEEAFNKYQNLLIDN